MRYKLFLICSLVSAVGACSSEEGGCGPGLFSRSLTVSNRYFQADVSEMGQGVLWLDSCGRSYVPDFSKNISSNEILELASKNVGGAAFSGTADGEITYSRNGAEYIFTIYKVRSLQKMSILERNAQHDKIVGRVDRK